MSGVESTGFVTKTQQEILSELETEQKANISPRLNVVTGPLGQLNGIVSSKLAEAWEVLEAIYHALDPDAASNAQLDVVASITGTTREQPTPSTVTLSVTLAAGTTLPAGSVASVTGSPTKRFVTLADVTNGGGSPATLPVEAESEEDGPIAANAGTITTIATPVAGWTAVTNAADAVRGTDLETDASLRTRRVLELTRAGSTTPDAVRADLLEIEGARTVVVFNNPTDATVDGIPPHAMEVLFYDGTVGGTAVDDQTIGDAIWAAFPGGIQAHGVTSVTVVDAAGNEQTVEFTRPTVRTVYLEFDLDVDPDAYPGDSYVENLIAEWGDDNLDVGDDVVIFRLLGILSDVEGVVDVTEVRAGFTASPSGTANLTIGAREIADLDTARISLTVTEV